MNTPMLKSIKSKADALEQTPFIQHMRILSTLLNKACEDVQASLSAPGKVDIYHFLPAQRYSHTEPDEADAKMHDILVNRVLHILTPRNPMNGFGKRDISPDKLIYTLTQLTNLEKYKAVARQEYFGRDDNPNAKTAANLRDKKYEETLRAIEITAADALEDFQENRKAQYGEYLTMHETYHTQKAKTESTKNAARTSAAEGPQTAQTEQGARSLLERVRNDLALRKIPRKRG